MTISPEYRKRLIVMVKFPVAGQVKTRLGRDIGMPAAAWWYRHQTKRLLQRVQSPEWETVLAISTTRQGNACAYWPQHLSRIEQGQGDLGQRMRHAFRQMPPGPAVLIGSDIPSVLPRHIRQAFAELGRNDSVVGPAPDGGYWLVGLHRPARCPARVFHGVRWSGPDALKDTLATMRGWRIGRVCELADVDTVADLQG